MRPLPVAAQSPLLARPHPPPFTLGGTSQSAVVYSLLLPWFAVLHQMQGMSWAENQVSGELRLALCPL